MIVVGSSIYDGEEGLDDEEIRHVRREFVCEI